MCDNCRDGKEEKTLVDLTIQAQMFLSCVKRTGEIFGAGHIIDVLRGSASQKIMKFGHETLSTYGIGKDHSSNQWRHLMRQLIQKDLLLYQYEHGSLKLTPKAWEVLRGKEPFFGRMDEPRKKNDKGRNAIQRPHADEATAFDPELFEALRKKRKALADEANLPPYAIFHDRTLQEMAATYPRNKEGMPALYGVGERKLEKYADAFLEIIREHLQTHPMPETPKPIQASEPATDSTPPENNGKRRYIVIGERFNQGRTIEELARDFNIQQNTVIEHLFRYRRKNRPLRKDVLINSLLPRDQQQAVFAAFARLGTKRLRPIFDDLNGTIPYDELKLLLLHYLTQDQNLPEDQKTFICLAASRKYSGYCIAGKEWMEGTVGPWLRPVSRQENGELSADIIRFDNGQQPQYLDIITIDAQGAQEHPYQRENILIAEERSWSRQGKFPVALLPDLVDDVASLWRNGYHSGPGLNDRVPEEVVRQIPESSLFLIRPNEFTILVSDDLDGRKKVRARFTYRDIPYLLSVTDPSIERAYLLRKQGEYQLNAEALYLTVSLGEPFNGYCYKLVAAIIMREE